MTQIERDASLVLRTLGKLTEGMNVDTTFVKGPDIQAATNLTPEQINDGVAFLDEKGYAIIRATLGTHPYSFRWAQITIKGRIEYQRQKTESEILFRCKKLLFERKWITGPAVLIIVGSIIAHTFDFHLSEINLPFITWARNPKEQVHPSTAPTAIFMETRMVGLPIKIPPRSVAHLLSLNKHRITSSHSTNWGFYDIPNDSNVERDWPDKKAMQSIFKGHNVGMFPWRAEVSNHGPGNVIDISIPIKLWFDNEKPEIVYNAIVTPLDKGASFVFYLVNDCPSDVSAAWPDNATLQVVGEQNRQVAQLHRSFTNPIDQIMIFFPSKTQMVGDFPCQ
jgi:hypothetical protein